MTGRPRHPSAWRPNLARLERRLADELRSRDSPWPAVGAAALLARGTAGARRDVWATTCGLDEAVVARTEAGALPLPQVPGALRERLARGRATPDPDAGEGS
jgi:hypothetical protein